MSGPIIIALLSCSWFQPNPWDGKLKPKSKQFEDPGLRETPPPPVIHLWTTPGEFQLPATVLPEGLNASSRFPVNFSVSPDKDRKHTSVWAINSPFNDETQGRVSAPPGMKLFVGGEPLDYQPNLAGESWRLRDGRLLVAHKKPLPKVEIEWVGAPKVLSRRDFSTAELEPMEFIAQEVSHGRHTRQGMLLPAPGTARWTVDIPKGAKFEAFPTMMPRPLNNMESDGAYVSLAVEIDGQRSELGKHFVSGDSSDFDQWTIDLSAFGGKKGVIELSTDPYGTRDFDHVFLGSPTVFGPRSPENIRRVLVIGLDTTRPDKFSFNGYHRPTEMIDAIAGSSVVFENSWTSAPRTRPSFRAATTGRYPLTAVGAQTIGKTFSDAGYATAGIVANIHLQPRFSFNDGFDTWQLDNGARADEQVDLALEYWADHPDRDTYMFLHIMDPHIFYNAPGSMRDMFVEDPDPDLPDTFNREMVLKWERTGKLDDRRKKHIEARYDAEILFLSQQLGRLFDKLDRMPGKSLVVVHNDHGEEFWEHDGFEHNNSLFQQVTGGMIWVRSGAGQENGRRAKTPATLADIGPTLYELAGIKDPPPTDGMSLANVLLKGEDTDLDRAIPVAFVRYGHERWGVILNQKKYILHTASGDEELYDLAADPAEKKDLSVKTNLTPYREALAEVHDMPVGRGWRIEVNATSLKDPVTFTLPEPALGAMVIEPERTIEEPRNQAWGEPPIRGVEEIGTVEMLTPTTLKWTPGTNPVDGLLMVHFGKDVDPTLAKVEQQGEDRPLAVAPGGWIWQLGSNRIAVRPGTVLLPLPTEAQRMRALRGGTEETGSDKAVLCALGYLEDCDEEESKPTSDGTEDD